MSKEKKFALRHQKELRQKRKELRQEITNFMVEFKGLTIENPQAELLHILRNGHRGFEYMKSRILINYFEQIYASLRDPKKYFVVYNHNWQWKNMDESEIRNQLMLTSENLMCRLMEVIFDLGE